jgi:hypothetical protein
VLATIATGQDVSARRVVADDLLTPGAEDMEIGVAKQRNRRPVLSAVARLDQAETGRKIVAQVGMARAEKAVGPDDGETHRVLVAVADASRRSLAATNAIEAGVAGDEQRIVERINAERMNMAGSRFA